MEVFYGGLHAWKESNRIWQSGHWRTSCVFDLLVAYKPLSLNLFSLFALLRLNLLSISSIVDVNLCIFADSVPLGPLGIKETVPLADSLIFFSIASSFLEESNQIDAEVFLIASIWDLCLVLRVLVFISHIAGQFGAPFFTDMTVDICIRSKIDETGRVGFLPPSHASNHLTRAVPRGAGTRRGVMTGWRLVWPLAVSEIFFDHIL